MLPMQDLLGLPAEHRMNVPGTGHGNWRWRFDWSQIPATLSARYAHLVSLYGRG
jgi:4-alpha-glucanotransferase